MSTLAEALSDTRSASRAVREMAADGWNVQRTFSIIEMNTVTTNPASNFSALRDSRLVADRVAATYTSGNASIEVLMESDGALYVIESEPVNFNQSFAQEHRRDAQMAWNGDAAAALRLPGEWTMRVVVDLSRELKLASPNFSWQVLNTAEDLLALVASEPAWGLGPLLDPDPAPVFVLEELGANQLLLLGRGAVVPLASDDAATEAFEHLESVTVDPWHIAELPGAPRPTAIYPVLMRGTELAPIERRVWDATAALAWVGLASAVRRTGDDLQIEILGLQRVTHEVPASGLDVSRAFARRSYELFAWAGGVDAIDQRLAVQQVTSLYQDKPWAKVDDIFDAAFAVYRSLRRDSVGEALQARRAARSFAVDVAHRAAEQVNSVTRSVAERLTASLLAIGGVIVAQTTSVIGMAQADSLRELVALFLLGLLVWNIAFEGPPLRASIRDLRNDLPRVADTLTEHEVQEILGLRSVTSAARRACAMSIVVPMVYLLAAGLAWCV